MTLDQTAILLRTNASNLNTLSFARKLKDHLDPKVYWVCDESQGSVESFEFSKISLTRSRFSRWNFSRHPRQWGWLCGDYAFYVAAEELPEFKYFLMLEPDVYASAETLGQFSEFLKGNTNAAIAAGLSRQKTPPRLSRNLKLVDAEANVGCFFPVTRASRELISTMFEIRKRVQCHVEKIRVNDEAVFASAALSSSFKTFNLNDLDGLFDPEVFRANPPFQLETNNALLSCKGFAHPVLPTSDLISRVLARKYSFERLRDVRKSAPDHVWQALRRADLRTKSLNVAQKLQHLECYDKHDRLGCLLDILKDFEPLHVVDVGANPIEGEVSYAHLLATGQCTVTGFEPAQEAWKKLTEMAGANECYLNVAIGDGTLQKFHLTKNSGFSSLFQPDQKSVDFLGFRRGARVLETTEVSTKRLDDLDAVAGIDFLKIDVQGGELAAISNGARKLSDCVAIQSEVRFFPLYENEPSFGALDDEIRAQGFQFHSFDFLKSASGHPRVKSVLKRQGYSQVVDGDAFYIRDLRDIGEFTHRQVAKLAMVADNAMERFDVVLICLEELKRRGRISEADITRYIDVIPPRFKI